MNNQKYKTAYILHCVEDAKFVIKNISDAKSLRIFVTHYSVNDYLNSKEIPSTDLSMLISDDLFNNYIEKADICINKVLVQLDTLLSQNISSILGVKLMKYFSPLYLNHSKFEYSAYCLFLDAFNLINEESFSKLFFFDSLNISFYSKNSFFLKYIKRYMQDSHCLFETIKNPLNDRKSNFFVVLRKAFANPSKIHPKIKKLISTKKKQKICNKSTVILLESLYDLEFLKSDLEQNTIVWPDKGCPHFIDSPQITNEQVVRIKNIIQSLSMKDFAITEDSILGVLIEIIINDFSNNIANYLTPVLTAQFVLQNTQVDAVIWGNPPVRGSKSLVNEFFLKIKIPVIGMQHGASYGIQEAKFFHFDSDFDRCTHYFSYGFDEKDFRLTYPECNAECKILPVGTTKKLLKKTQNKHKKIDILFPITNCMSFWFPKRLNPYLLAGYQKKIIDKLEKFIDIKIKIKMMPGYSDKNFAFVERVKQLSHSQIGSLPLNDFLEKTSPKMVIIEFVSTPLYEILDEDIEILVLNDLLIPFNKEALNLLKKRVHVFNDIEELLKGIDLWCDGKLSSLRDDQFYHKYIYKKNSKKVIISEIDRIIRNRRKLN